MKQYRDGQRSVLLGDPWASKDGFSRSFSVTQPSLESSKFQPGCHPATRVQRSQRDAEFGQMQKTILNKPESVSGPQTCPSNTSGNVSVL